MQRVRAGHGLGAGHYLCAVVDRRSRQWKCYDDDVMTEIGGFARLAERQETHGYLFFYVHQPAPP